MNQVTLENIAEIAKDLRKLFKIGTLIIITGEMGAGKTTLLKHILSEYSVASPSFLHALYYGTDFLHIDAYTIEDKFFFLFDLEEALSSRCVIIEWGNLVKEFLENFENPKVFINIDISRDGTNRMLDVKIKEKA